MMFIYALIVLLFVSLYDTWYTYWLLRRGFFEANRTMAWLMDHVDKVWVYLITAVFWIVITYVLWRTTREIYETDGAFYAGISIPIIGHSYAILHNWYIYKKSKRSYR